MDLAIRNATIVDGTGRARYGGDVGISGGKIVAVGVVAGRAREEIDASGLVVAPGFIDCHTHYDAQVKWDAMLSPSVYHGITTAIMGNCGFTLAPLSGRKADLDYLLPMLAKVEGMPLRSLEATIRPTWRTFGEFLDGLDGTLAINTVFLAGHSTIRRYVMGDRAVGNEATADEIAAMVELLRQAMREGAAGFSTTIGFAHLDHNGDPVPSRWANDEELITLSEAVKDFEGTWLEMNPSGAPWQRQRELLTEMSLRGQRALNWNLVVVRAESQEALNEQIELGRYAAERGARIYGLVPAVPIKNVINFRTGMLLEMLDGWQDLIQAPHDAKLRLMRDPALRRRLEAGLKASYWRAALTEDVGDMKIEHLISVKNARWIGHTISEYAAEAGSSAFDALFDLAIEEDLWLSFSPPDIGSDEASNKLRGEIWQNDYFLIGGSDAGAHIDAINTFAVSTQLLGEGVRKLGLITLEEAVRRITSLPADAFGITGRGRIAIDAAADLVAFDPDSIDCGPITMRNDVPGGETRLYSESIGVEHVIVNGVPVAANNRPTGRLGGKVLRSGKDTFTVPLMN